MRKGMLAIVLGSLVAVAAAAAEKAAKLTCTLTQKTIEKCCCVVQKDGKLYCTLAKKTIEACCCEPVKK